MHWVVCKTQEEEIEREFSSRLERGKLGQHRGHISQDKVGTNPKGAFCFIAELFFLLLEAVLYGSVQSVQQEEEGTKIEAVLAQFSRQISRVLLVVVGPYRTVCTTDCCTIFEVQFSGRVVQQYGLGTNYEADFGTVLGVVSGFFLAGNCDFVADMYFPEAE
jgi:hypothetical protein